MSATQTSVLYSQGTVPLGGMGTWAGTWPGQPTVASPLNAIRNGAGRYWTNADNQSGQNTPGQARPMSSFVRNMYATQGVSAQGFPTTLTLPNVNTEINVQGTLGTTTFGISAGSSTFNLRVAPGSAIYGGRIFAGKGGGYPLQPATAGSTGETAINVQGGGPSAVQILNYGTVYGGGGGGGGGGYGLQAAVYAGGGGGGGVGGTAGTTFGATAPVAAQAGQSSGALLGGGGAVIPRLPTGLLKGGAGGNHGAAGSAGAAGQPGGIYTPTQQLQATSGGGGAGGSVGASATGLYAWTVAGTHN